MAFGAGNVGTAYAPLPRAFPSRGRRLTSWSSPPPPAGHPRLAHLVSMALVALSTGANPLEHTTAGCCTLCFAKRLPPGVPTAMHHARCPAAGCFGATPSAGPTGLFYQNWLPLFSPMQGVLVQPPQLGHPGRCG